MSILTIVLAIIVLFVLIWAVQYLGTAFQIPSQLQAIILVLLVILGVVYIVSLLSGHAGGLRLP